MPIELEIIHGGTGLVRKGSGHLTGSELIRSVTEFIASGEDVKKVIYSIVDYSLVDSIDITYEQIRSLAEINKNTSEINPNIIVAIISPKDEIFGLSRMWEVYVEQIPWPTKVFRARPGAEAWIKEQIIKSSDQAHH